MRILRLEAFQEDKVGHGVLLDEPDQPQEEQACFKLTDFYVSILSPDNHEIFDIKNNVVDLSAFGVAEEIG